MAQGVTVDFNANIARFTSALDKAANDLTKFQQHSDRVSGQVNKALGALGGGLSVAGITAFIKHSIDAADHMNDLAKTTGLTVEQVAGLQLIAKQTGSDLDGMALALSKLSVNMGKDAQKFKDIGITAKDPIKALQQLADIFVGIEDPQKRAAVAAAALGKSWQVVAPALAEGGDAIGTMAEKGIALSGSVKKMAERSDDFNDKLAEMEQKTQGLIANALTPLLPLMLEVADYMNDTGDGAHAAGEGMNFLSEVFKAAAVFGANISFVLKAVGRELGGIAAQMTELLTGDWVHGKSNFTAIGEQMKKDAEQARKELDEFEQRLLNPPAPKQKEKPSSVETSQAAIKKFVGDPGVAEADAVRKKMLENRLKALEDAAKAEAQILAARNKLLDYYYNDNQISIENYYAGKNAAQEDSLQKTLKAYDDEIAALEVYRSKATKEADKVETTGKINELLEKKRKLEEDSAEATLMNSLSQQKSNKEMSRTLAELNVQYLNMNYRLGEAAGLSFDLSNAQLKERLTTEGNIEALKKLDELRARAVENASTAGEAGFQRAMRNYKNMATDTGKQIEQAMTNAFKGMEDALVNFVRKGELDFGAFADAIISDMLRISIQQNITGPLAGMLALTFRSPASTGGGIPAGTLPAGGMQAAKGAWFDGSVAAFANGGIFDSPKLFKFAAGGSFKLGMLGEAGPEAIMPLKRDASGRLGVRADGNGGQSMSVNYSPTIHIDSRADQAEVRRIIQRAIADGNAQLVDQLQRQGKIA